MTRRWPPIVVGPVLALTVLLAGCSGTSPNPGPAGPTTNPTSNPTSSADTSATSSSTGTTSSSTTSSTTSTTTTTTTTRPTEPTPPPAGDFDVEVDPTGPVAVDTAFTVRAVHRSGSRDFRIRQTTDGCQLYLAAGDAGTTGLWRWLSGSEPGRCQFSIEQTNGPTKPVTVEVVSPPAPPTFVLWIDVQSPVPLGSTFSVRAVWERPSDAEVELGAFGGCSLTRRATNRMDVRATGAGQDCDVVGRDGATGYEQSVKLRIAPPPTTTTSTTTPPSTTTTSRTSTSTTAASSTTKPATTIPSTTEPPTTTVPSTTTTKKPKCRRHREVEDWGWGKGHRCKKQSWDR